MITTGTKNIKKPVIRGKHAGKWVYYMFTMSFRELADYVSPTTSNIGKSEAEEMAECLKDVTTRFVGAVVLMIKGEGCTYREIGLGSVIPNYAYNAGILTIPVKKSTFICVDGMRKISGIAQILQDHPELHLDNTEVPVILLCYTCEEDIAHLREAFGKYADASAARSEENGSNECPAPLPNGGLTVQALIDNLSDYNGSLPVVVYDGESGIGHPLTLEDCGLDRVDDPLHFGSEVVYGINKKGE